MRSEKQIPSKPKKVQLKNAFENILFGERHQITFVFIRAVPEAIKATVLVHVIKSVRSEKQIPSKTKKVQL